MTTWLWHLIDAWEDRLQRKREAAYWHSLVDIDLDKLP